MTKAEFIRTNRVEIDAAINRVLNFVPSQASCYCHLSGTDHRHNDEPKRNDSERVEWLANDEGLYLWARREGVRI
jgi:hypothetical protein